MSNFLLNVIFVICNLIGYLAEKNFGNWANAENDSPSEITHKIKRFWPNLMICWIIMMAKCCSTQFIEKLTVE